MLQASGKEKVRVDVGKGKGTSNLKMQHPQENLLCSLLSQHFNFRKSQIRNIDYKKQKLWKVLFPFGVPLFLLSIIPVCILQSYLSKP